MKGNGRPDPRFSLAVGIVFLIVAAVRAGNLADSSNGSLIITALYLIVGLALVIDGGLRLRRRG